MIVDVITGSMKLFASSDLMALQETCAFLGIPASSSESKICDLILREFLLRINKSYVLDLDSSIDYEVEGQINRDIGRKKLQTI